MDTTRQEIKPLGQQQQQQQQPVRTGPVPSLPAPPPPQHSSSSSVSVSNDHDSDGDGSAAVAAAAAAAEEYERQHVHGVYSAIAPHFSSTRHKPWPAVARFLSTLAPGAVGVDIGCGNGKYLGVNEDVYILGCDRSAELVGIAAERTRTRTRTRSTTTTTTTTTKRSEEKETTTGKGSGEGGNGGDDVLVADGLALPFLRMRADFAICIAVVHHLSTRSRRREAIRAVLECVKTTKKGSTETEGGGGGRALVYVWALEQASSRRGWEKGGEQDLLVPWVIKEAQKKKHDKKKNLKLKGSEDQKKENQEEDQEEKEEDQKKQHNEEETFHRYYHLYKEGELEEDVQAVGGTVVESGYERDNWWVVCSH